jgi:hypothetical protein
MPDTSANQAEYPQHPNQKPGCGFPIARIVVLIALATGCVLDAAIGSSRGKLTGEHALLRSMRGRLKAGDILLADAYYSSFDAVIGLVQAGVDVVMRQAGNRATDFGRGIRLGREDHLVEWHRSRNRPGWMSPAEFAALPRVLWVRELKVRVDQPGFRTKEFVVVTTLLDAVVYPRSQIAGLYRARWHAEVCQADYIPRGGLYPSARWAHSERGGAAAPGLLVPGASSRHRRTDAMRSDSERPAPPRPRAA